jgi:hypothetical protein
MELGAYWGKVRFIGCNGGYMGARILLGAILSLVPSVLCAASTPPVGHYQISVTMGSPGLVMEEIYNSNECLTQSDVSGGPGAYVDSRPDDEMTCDGAEYALGEGTIEWEIACTFGITKAAIKGTGTFSDEGIFMDNDVILGVQGLELQVKAELKAAYVGACPVAEAPEQAEESEVPQGQVPQPPEVATPQ